MPDLPRRLILANGEQYQKPVEKRLGGGPKEWPRSYDEARDRVKRDVELALQEFAELPARKKRPDETVLCLRLHPDMMAKSYDPAAVFAAVPDLQSVGSRNYKVVAKEVAVTKSIRKQLEANLQFATGRMIFVRGNDAGFRRLLRTLDASEQTLTDAFRNNVRSIEHFDLLKPAEQVVGFENHPGWKEGRVELVLHPSRHSELEQTHFLRELFSGCDLPWSKARIVPYPDGPTFISCRLDTAALNALAGANPLRAAHPLVFGGLDDLRSGSRLAAPPPPVTTTRSTILVGVIDGGIDVNLPHLLNHAEQDEGLSIKTPVDPLYVAHGTAVAGAVLYGPLNDLDTKSPLPSPSVGVVSVRALPPSDPADADLYESIDVIENAIPARPDVKFWNLSFGPRGPILDDTISRFTFALDALATEHKVGFAVAVGNDGEAGADMGRIQSPSDMVNGLGVGAHMRIGGKIRHAPYSCQGPGRECGKLKPDLVAFGGCDTSPIHLVASTSGEKVAWKGTSFASPLVASLGGQLLGNVDRSTALLARALLIHTAQHPEEEPDMLLGHGIIPRSFDEVVRCGEKSVTVLFQGALVSSKYAKLPMMLPPNVVNEGKLELRWTIAGLPAVDPNHPADYTTICIEDTFYPNSLVFGLTKKIAGGKSRTSRVNVRDDADELSRLIADGWRKPDFPVSDSRNDYPREHERRALDYKWEPSFASQHPNWLLRCTTLSSCCTQFHGTEPQADSTMQRSLPSPLRSSAETSTMPCAATTTRCNRCD